VGRLTSSLSGASLALVGDTTARMHELAAADRVLRMPIPLSRRVSFVSLRGGSGTSSTAAYVASIYARRRTGMVLGVDAAPGGAGLTWHAGVPDGALQRPSGARLAARRAADAIDGLPRTRAGLYTLDLGADSVTGSPGAAAWQEQLPPIARFFDVVAADWGVRSWRLDLAPVAAASHVVCLVARADRHALEDAAAVVPALLEHEDRPRVVLASVDVGRTGGRAAPLLSRRLGVPVLAIPYDAARAATRPASSTALATRTRIAYTALATTLLREAQR
jgi:MinD-like ATPase involved in chromosome partitioning or flagellar assembly